jgi:hypothetical protein
MVKLKRFDLNLKLSDNGAMNGLVVASLILGALLAHPGQALAVYAQSNSYSVDETLLGGTGLTDQGSTSYEARTGVGDIVVGNPTSTSFDSQTGNISDPEPALTFTVNNPNASFTTLFSRTSVSHALATFSVKNYTSYGYSVYLYGTTLKHNGSNYEIPALAANTASTPGTEQFGVNLAANTGFGSDPAQIPSGAFSNGSAAANYDTADSFRFVSGEQVAAATQSSGQTDFTLSYIANVKGTTPGGTYSATQILICVGTY